MGNEVGRNEEAGERFDLEASLAWIRRTSSRHDNCPNCGRNGWAIESLYTDKGYPSWSQEAPAFLPKDRRGFGLSYPAIPLLLMTCVWCAFVRTFNLTYIRDRMRVEAETPEAAIYPDE